ncbi:MAG: class I SAM-dependent methyltransferase [Woeseiaceae bacterium]|nr:class I SAM-dependent methyltransferase [Woeseiaceae bacterium]
MFEAIDTLANYWEKRAVRFARERDGLAAVCSYGMPQFYNRVIEICQRRALRPWLRCIREQDVLEVGCGVGRWTQELAENSNRVSAFDLSPTMIAATRQRLDSLDLDADLQVADVASFQSDRQFDAIVSVTVIQHVTDESEFSQVFERLANLVRPGGKAILLEAAPSNDNERCDSPIFRARPLNAYKTLFEENGFRIDEISGVDPMPFKTWLLPHLRSMPRPLADIAANIAAAVSLPLDLLCARWMTKRSWHKVIVATRAGVPCAKT